jgi:hypothetical protein
LKLIPYIYLDLKKSINLKKNSEDTSSKPNKAHSAMSNHNINNIVNKDKTDQPSKFVNVNKIVNDEVNLVSVHMGVIKEDASLLTEEGDLVSNVKGVGDVDYEMDAYIIDLERIIAKKIKMYKKLKTKIEILRYNHQKLKKDTNLVSNSDNSKTKEKMQSEED